MPSPPPISSGHPYAVVLPQSGESSSPHLAISASSPLLLGFSVPLSCGFCATLLEAVILLFPYSSSFPLPNASPPPSEPVLAPLLAAILFLFLPVSVSLALVGASLVFLLLFSFVPSLPPFSSSPFPPLFSSSPSPLPFSSSPSLPSQNHLLSQPKTCCSCEEEVKPTHHPLLPTALFFCLAHFLQCCASTMEL